MGEGATPRLPPMLSVQLVAAATAVATPPPTLVGDAKHVEVGLELANAVVAISARQLEWARAILEDVVGASPGGADADDSSCSCSASDGEDSESVARGAGEDGGGQEPLVLHRADPQALAVPLGEAGEATAGAAVDEHGAVGGGGLACRAPDEPTAPPPVGRLAADGFKVAATRGTEGDAAGTDGAAEAEGVGHHPSAAVTASILLPAAGGYQAPDSTLPGDGAGASYWEDGAATAKPAPEVAAPPGAFRSFWHTLTAETALDNTATANSEDAAVVLGLRPPYGSSPAVSSSESDATDGYGSRGDSLDGDDDGGDSSSASSGDTAGAALAAAGLSSDGSGGASSRLPRAGSTGAHGGGGGGTGGGGGGGLLDALSVQAPPPPAVPAATTPADTPAAWAGNSHRGSLRRDRSSSSIRGGATASDGDGSEREGGSGGDGGGGASVAAAAATTAAAAAAAAAAWPRPRSRASLLRALRRAAAAGGQIGRAHV